ncbi:MAG: hypothetical protein D9V47_10575 [Clostridia bacterium]|nr:MAG: hypothetical protein D9V47_10575 [Clostridia bacterium]
MSSYPYPENEKYPDDQAHQEYQREWNTRVFAPAGDGQAENGGKALSVLQNALDWIKGALGKMRGTVIRPYSLAEKLIQWLEATAFSGRQNGAAEAKPVQLTLRRADSGAAPEKQGVHYSLNTNYAGLVVTKNNSSYAYGLNSSGSDTWKSSSMPTPSSPGIQATVAEKAYATNQDSSWWTTSLVSGDGQYNYQMYRFTVAEKAADIDKIIVRWTGYGEPTTGYDVELFWWDFSASSWTPLMTQHASTDTAFQDVTRIDQTEFCTRCHDNSPPSGVTMGTVMQISPAYGTDRHGSGSGPEGYSNGSLVNYNFRGMPRLSCNECHDEHGSGNVYHLRETVNGKTGITITDINNNASFTNFCTGCHNGNGNNFHAGCLSCHYEGHSGEPLGPDFGRACVSCHKHGSYFVHYEGNWCHGCAPSGGIGAF